MIKKTLSITLNIALLFLFLSLPEIGYSASPVSITARSATLYDLQANRFIYVKTPHLKRAPASTTKLLTAMVVLDRLPLNKEITIPKYAESVQPSKIYLKAGERFYVRDLVRAILISSANDAAEVLAIATAGSLSNFSGYLNSKAKSIGARSSNFKKASGLPAKGQYSTAHDLALISKHAQRYLFIVETLKRKTMNIQSLGGRKVYLKNHNKMLWKDPREIIGKTGWTKKAKHCFVGYIGLPNKKVIVSLMGSHSMWRDLMRLADYQFGWSFTKILKNKKIWSTGETKKIQTALRKAGYSPGPADGKFGPKTLRAVESFQKANGLQVDGIVGSITWKKLEAYL